jgi:hypothetical protein
MTSIDESAIVATSPDTHRAGPVPPATPTENLVMMLFGTWLMGGAMLDGWAHNNIIKTLESFFTPWHAVLYSGFAACAVWTFLIGYRRRHVAPEWWRDGWPAGYRVGALGIVIFLFAGGADMAWHTIFGIEANLAAGLSPSHLLLCVGSTLLLTSPLRSWWAAGSPKGLPAVAGVGALALATTSVSVFLGYALAFYPAWPLRLYVAKDIGTAQSNQAALGVACYVVTTVMLVVSLLFIHRRRATPGTATALVGAVALFALGTHEFPRTQTIAAVAAVVAAAVVDLLLVRLDKVRGTDAPLRLPIAGALLPVLVWPAQFIALDLAAGVRWPAELIGGSVVVTVGVGALLGGLAARPAPVTVNT